MKLRCRLVIFIGLTTACMVAGLYLLSSRVMMGSFLELEHQDADRDVQRAARALHQMVDELHVRSTDWAAWDDTYNFMLDHSKSYIDSNLLDVSVINMNLDLVMYVAQDGKLFHAKRVTRDKRVAAPVPGKIFDVLKRDGDFQTSSTTIRGKCGLIEEAFGPMMVSVRPIHNSEGLGEQRGWLVFGRRIDQVVVQRLNGITRLEIEARPIGPQLRAGDWATVLAKLDDLNPRFEAPVNDRAIAGYTTISDLQGRPALALKIVKPRGIYEQGLDSIAFMARMIMAAGLLFGLVTLFVLERFALSRVFRLSHQVEEIGDESTGVRISLPGRDEITSLASNINEMLSKLEKRSSEIAAKNLVLENAVEGISELDFEGRFLSVNASLARMLGYTQTELIGTLWMSTVSESGRAALDRAMMESKELGRAQVELEVVRKDGSSSFLEVTIVRQINTQCTKYGWHCFMKDISERKRLEHDIQHQAFHDRLTGLPNRSLFLDRMEKAITKSRRTGLNTAALFIDLDNFKQVNDSLGHAAGDLLLQSVAQRLIRAIRDVDTVARLGGDEFTILLEDLACVDEAVEICGRVLDELRSSIDLDGTEVFAHGSIGLAYNTNGSITAEEMMKNADRAMYFAKSSGKGGYVLFDQAMDDEASALLELEGSLSNAVENGEIYVEYQPVIDLDSGASVGAEALARWRTNKHGLVAQDQFIRIAEESGLIVPIGYWVLEESCRQMKTWRASHPKERLSLSFNVSGKQLQRPDFVDKIRGVLSKTGLEPNSLELEITESVLMANRKDVLAKLVELKNIGVKLTLDDFGTGFSSLTTLSSFPVDTLKIDRSLVSNLDFGRESRPVVEAIIAMAQSMKIDVVGEGIETGFQMFSLKELGCSQGQGFLFDAPLSAEAFETRLESGGTSKAIETRRRQLEEIQAMFRDSSESGRKPAA